MVEADDGRVMAGKRLVLGISNVGTWVLVALSVLAFMQGADFDGFTATSVVALGSLALFLQGIFDFIGGFLLGPTPRPSIQRFLAHWSRGVVLHSLMLGVIAALTLWSYAQFGTPAVSIVVGSLLLVLIRLPILRWIRGQDFENSYFQGRSLVNLEASDRGFTGGLSGLRRPYNNVIPREWQEALDEGALRAELARRTWQTAKWLPLRSFIFSTSWNAVGGGLAQRVVWPLSMEWGNAPGWLCGHDDPLGLFWSARFAECGQAQRVRGGPRRAYRWTAG